MIKQYKKGFIGAFVVVAIAALTFAGFLISKTIKSSTSVGDGINTIPQLQTYKTKVSSNDSTPGYLNGKLVAGTGISFVENNDGANETLTISGSGGVSSVTASNNSVTISPTTGAVTVSVPGALVHPTVGSTYEYQYKPVSVLGGYNTAIGIDALKSNTIGVYNIAYGGDALKNATDATGVIAIGFEAAKSVVVGSANSVIIGTSNASLATTLSTSTLIGTRLATSTSGVVSTVGVGDLMFQSINSSAQQNLGIGFNLFNAITSDQQNYGIGKDIGDAATSISATYSFGESLFRNATGVSGAFAFGSNQFNNLAFANNLYGFGTSNMTGAGAGGLDAFLIGSGIANNGAAFLDGVIAIGTSIAGNNSDPYLSSDILIGKNAGLQGTSLVNEIYIGESAGGNSTTGTGNISIGAASGYGIVSGQNNVYIGYQSGNTYDGSGNVSNGLGSMYSWNGSYNVFSGTSAGNFGAGDYITGVGYSTFATSSVVTRSIALGAYAGSTYSTDVTDVVLIGYGTEASTTNATNELDFGSETSALTQVWLGWGGLPSTAPASGNVTIQPTTSTNGTVGASLHLKAGQDSGGGGVEGNVVVDGTGSLIIPVGTSGQRPTAVQGMIRYNTTTSRFEGYDGATWVNLN